MISVAVIQELFSILFVLGLSFYFYTASKQRCFALWARAIPPCASAVPRRPVLLFSTVHAEKESGALGTPAMQRALRAGRASTRPHSSVAGDWLAPLIVWFL
ncbi:MAG: hypothetical protein ACRD3Q_05015, partial [Terriglobales bacterium]